MVRTGFGFPLAQAAPGFLPAPARFPLPLPMDVSFMLYNLNEYRTVEELPFLNRSVRLRDYKLI